MKHAAEFPCAGIWWASLVVLVTCYSADVAQARPELGPPSVKLRTNLSNVAIARLESVSEDHQLIFEIKENLHNEAGEKVTIRSDALTSAMLDVGQTYVIAFVQWDVTTFPRVVRPRRDGAVIINLAGAKPAIFQPNGDLIRMLTWDLESSLQSPDTMLPLILRGMAEPDPQLQSFFATELVTRPTLHSELTRKQRRTVAAYIGDAAYSAVARSLMLGHSEFSDLLLSQSDKLDIARDIVVHYPVNVGFGSEYGGLIRTAMKIMEESKKKSDVQVMQRWLTSNQPALLESAASVIYEVNSDALIGALEQASRHTLLEEQSRATLQNLLRRYRPCPSDKRCQAE